MDLDLGSSLDYVGCITDKCLGYSNYHENYRWQDSVTIKTTNSNEVPNYTKFLEESVNQKITVGIPKRIFF